MSNEDPIQLINSSNNPSIDFLVINMSIDASVVNDNIKIEAEHDAMKQRLNTVASSRNLHTRKGKRHWRELEIPLHDNAEEVKVMISLDPYRYSKNTDKFGHNFFRLSISSGFTENILQQIVEILQEVLGTYFEKLRQHARITRIDLAFDFEMDINLLDFNRLHFTASHFQMSGIADNFAQFSRGAHLSTCYLGGRRSDQIVIYDRGLKLQKKGKKLDKLRGILVRIELRLRPRKPYTVNDILYAYSRGMELLKRFSVYRLTSLRRVSPGNILHLFLMACQWQGYKAVMAAIRKDNKNRARWIERQFTKVPLDDQQMRSKLYDLLNNFADQLGPSD